MGLFRRKMSDIEFVRAMVFGVFREPDMDPRRLDLSATGQEVQAAREKIRPEIHALGVASVDVVLAGDLPLANLFSAKARQIWEQDYPADVYPWFKVHARSITYRKLAGEVSLRDSVEEVGRALARHCGFPGDFLLMAFGAQYYANIYRVAADLLADRVIRRSSPNAIQRYQMSDRI